MTHLSTQEQQRLRELRSRATLRADEAEQLTILLQRADADESVALAPRTRDLEAENHKAEAENRQLAALVERKQRLANRLANELQTSLRDALSQ